MNLAVKVEVARTSSFHVAEAKLAMLLVVKPLEERSLLGRKLAAGEFVTMVEIVPPKGVGPGKGAGGGEISARGGH